MNAILAGGLTLEEAYGTIEADSSHGTEAEMRAWALENLEYGEFENSVFTGIRSLDGIIAGRLTSIVSEPCRNVFDPDFGTAVYVDRSKMKFALRAPKLPVRVVYDIVKSTGGGDTETHLADQEFTLRSDGDVEQVIEIPLIESTHPDQVLTWMDNVRLFFCPYHL